MVRRLCKRKRHKTHSLLANHGRVPPLHEDFPCPKCVRCDGSPYHTHETSPRLRKPASQQTRVSLAAIGNPRRSANEDCDSGDSAPATAAAGILSRSGVAQNARNTRLRHLPFPARAMFWLLRAPGSSLSHTLDGPGRPVRFAAHRQPLCWNFTYHSRIVLYVGVSVWHMVRNHRCTIIIDSVLANSKTHTAFLSPIHAMFRHDCPLAVKPTSTLRSLLPKQTWTDALPADILRSAAYILVVAQPSSKFSEGLMN